MNELKRNRLYIPQGIKIRREYFEGFGKQELIYLIISTAVSSLVAYIMYKCLHISIIKAMMFVTFVPTLVCFLTVKTETNLSVWEQGKLLVKFQKSQKFFPYVALNELSELEK